MFDTYPENAFQFNDIYSLRNYISGGRGIVTLESPSGESLTYAIQRPRNPGKFPDGTYFIYAQVDTKWLYVGMISADTEFQITRHSVWNYDSKISKGAKYLVDMIAGRITHTPMKVYHAGVCSICGRKLESTKSIIAGMGPRCKKKHELQKRTRSTTVSESINT